MKCLSNDFAFETDAEMVGVALVYETSSAI